MRTLLCLFLLCSLVLAQDSNSAGQGQSLADVARKLRKDHTQETRLTPEEEKKLLGSISELFTFASEDSGFAKRSVVKSRFVEEKEVETSTRSEENTSELQSPYV